MKSPMPKGRRTQHSPPVLELLTAEECRTVFDQLLVAHPDLREEAEHYAAEQLSSPSVEEIAVEVELALEGIPLASLSVRAGRVPGRGYVHEGDAAWELVEEELRPFLSDLERRAAAGFDEAAAAVATAIIAGLYRVRDPEMGSVLAYAGEDALEELAGQVIAVTGRLGVFFAEGVGDEHWPLWDPLT